MQHHNIIHILPLLYVHSNITQLCLSVSNGYSLSPMGQYKYQGDVMTCIHLHDKTIRVHTCTACMHDQLVTEITHINRTFLLDDVQGVATSLEPWRALRKVDHTNLILHLQLLLHTLVIRHRKWLRRATWKPCPENIHLHSDNGEVQ